MAGKKTHGESHRSIEYMAWERMRSRCNNPRFASYKYYGGRGISVCEEWQHDYTAFLQCVGRRPGPDYSLDRIDGAKNYEPGNVRWATLFEQNQNRRNVRFLTIDGITKCVSEWARALGISRQKVYRTYL
jgi:hypothetical protein